MRFHARPCPVVPARMIGTNFCRIGRQRGAKMSMGCVGTSLRDLSTSWSGTGSQEDFMIRDTCILVDEQDNILGHASKKDSHRFTLSEPGLLHRAFSVFLFNSENKLLLQQRASCKITFPDVWTNTCCSHPLHGFNPPEVDPTDQVALGHAVGTKHAAARKLYHELGIEPHQVPVSDFKFLTRLHYCARDEFKNGQEVGWGEHEMDYILFIKRNVDVKANPEEVKDWKYVSMRELQSMMDPNSGLKWSPWFRIIAKNFLEEWWGDLDAVLGSEKYVDAKTIHRINC